MKKISHENTKEPASTLLKIKKRKGKKMTEE